MSARHDTIERYRRQQARATREARAEPMVGYTVQLRPEPIGDVAEVDEGDFPVLRECPAQDLHHLRLITDRQYVTARNRIETGAYAFRTGERVQQRLGITRIPVVVHVVWNTDAQNISEEQVRSQIEVLNQDYRMTNPGVSQIPDIWKPLAADARIEFFLADRDPGGNATTGITRTKTETTIFLALDDYMKFTETGGIDAWPTDRYLNIWVVPRIRGASYSPNVLGYAQFPGIDEAIDGVVIRHDCFGTTGTAAANPRFNGGRTATHEVGHWLNLYHIWGDDGTGCGGTDEVDDTPNAGGSNAGCPQFPKLSCASGSNGEMFMNYMDYVDDACMHLFTAGQVQRMQATLDGPRSNLVQQQGAQGAQAAAASCPPKSCGN
jgi:hypothetical protein